MAGARSSAIFVSRRMFLRRLAAGAALLRFEACGVSPGGHTGAAGSGDGGVAACPPFLTPVEGFYRQFGGRSTVKGWSLPDLDADSFELSVTGLVASEMRVKLADLEADAGQHQTVLKTMICVLGYRSTQIFTGVPLRVLLDRAGIDRERAVRVRFLGADGFENNLRVGDIYDNPADLFPPLIAFRIGGQPLPRELGFPFRLLLGDRYGYKNTKWLTQISVVDSDQVVGQYQAEGYPDDGVIPVMALVENLRITEMVEPGPVELCGFALSGAAAIERVEVAVDDGAFGAAQLSELMELTDSYPELRESLQLSDPAHFGFPLRGVWVAFRFSFDARPGQHRVRVRVRDRAGNMDESTAIQLTAAS